MIKFFIAAMAVLFAVNTANAAEVTVHKFNTTEDHYIYLSGVIVEGDFERIKKAYADPRIKFNSLLFLNSPGGDGAEMKMISEWIRSKSLRAVVHESHICYSACAVIWASAANRTAGEGAEIGFHISSIAIQPDSIEWLEDMKQGYGWAGIMDIIQNQYALDIQYYLTLPVAYPRELALEIALKGDKFFMITKDNSWIIGEVFWKTK